MLLAPPYIKKSQRGKGPIVKPLAIPWHCGDNQKVMALHPRLAILVGGGGTWIQMTGALQHKQRHHARYSKGSKEMNFLSEINYPEFRRYHYKNHFYNLREAWWPSGRASDSGARGRGSILTQVPVLCP